MAQAENAKKLDYTPVTYDDQYILMVNQLKKYFPIKGGLMSQTVGHVKAVDGVTFNLKRGHTMVWSANPAAANPPPAVQSCALPAKKPAVRYCSTAKKCTI